MSADNWRACPACFRRAVEEFEEKRQAVMASYGQIPVEEFDAKRAAMGDPPSLDEWQETDERCVLREDYQIGIHANKDGSPEFFVHYTASCQVCDLVHEFKHREAVQTP